MKSKLLTLGLLGAVVWLGINRSLALEGAVVIANESVPMSSISSDALKDIYNAKTAYWQGGQTIVIIVLADKTNAALKEVSGMDASHFKTFWQRLAFSGRGKLPQKLEDASAVVTLVASTMGAIALVPLDTDLKGVKKLEVK